MDLPDEIADRILRRQYELSKHALDRSIRREVSMAEIEEAVANRPEIIEDYPDDKHGPTCLILGFTSGGRPLHLLCSHPSRPIVKIITLYEPDPDQWIEFRRRRDE